eukprot:gnl/MRDRNA2_/MRDRNA2_75530_c0_seq1.p1 gnl/MRDRNA2_/MRDRNA2_75530_c0~~gnl/MRDRNA2_/MRDRNA2_75530_c0_seq1.p1  ORF type:complete len:522 (-),score=79.79 gnl/MRDRNA2_/MRDRNA2_75530_c0_seq1:517-2082(-)
MIFSPFHQFSLRFSNQQIEDEYVQQQLPFLAYALRRFAQVALPVCLFQAVVVALEARKAKNLSGLYSRPVWFVLLTLAIEIFMCVGIILWLQRQGSKDAGKKLQPAALERTSLALGVLTIFTIVGVNKFRVAVLFGFEPEEVWGDITFTDSSFTLLLDAVLTMMCFMPIRVDQVRWIPLVVIFTYLGTFLAIGSPDAVANIIINILTMAAMGYLTLHGSKRMETQLRQQFDEVAKAKNQMLSERVLRFDLEHQFERLAPKAASENSGGGNAATLRDDRLSDTVSFNLSSVTGKSTGRPSSHEESIQTDLSWTVKTGFKCLRCSRPPPASGRTKETDEAAVWEAVQKYGRSAKPRTSMSRSSSSSSSGSSNEASMIDNPCSSASSRATGKNGFAITPFEAIKEFVEEGLLRMNIDTEALGLAPCCQWHLAIWVVTRSLKRMRTQPCDQSFAPFDAAQCIQCMFLADEHEECCGICAGDLYGPGWVPHQHRSHARLRKKVANHDVNATSDANDRRDKVSVVSL